MQLSTVFPTAGEPQGKKQFKIRSCPPGAGTGALSGFPPLFFVRPIAHEHEGRPKCQIFIFPPRTDSLPILLGCPLFFVFTRAAAGPPPEAAHAPPHPHSIAMLRPGSRADARKKDFKKAIDADDARRKREDASIQLRKEKKEEMISKKRREGMNMLQPYAMGDASRGFAGATQKVPAAPCLLPHSHTLFFLAVFSRSMSRLSVRRRAPHRRSWSSCPSWCKECGARTRRCS